MCYGVELRKFHKIRLAGHNQHEMEFQKEEDRIEYWYEAVFLDHLIGNSNVDRARMIKRAWRTGD